MADQNNSLTNLVDNATIDPLAQTYQAIEDKYSYVTGGPNQSLINSLNQQSQAKAQQYKQNRADASNMYGQLTQTVDQGINVIQKGYKQAINESQQNTLGASSALGDQLQRQVAQRQNTANNLGMGSQVAAMGNPTIDRGNELMANILGSGQNWQNLLRSQQQAAKRQGIDTKTALGQSKNQTMIALQQALQQGQGNIANQIAQEQSKVGTKQITPLGQVYLNALGTKMNTAMNPTNTGADRFSTGINAFENNPQLIAMGLGKPSEFVNPDTGESYADPNTAAAAWQLYWTSRLNQAYSNDSIKAGKPLDPALVAFGQVFGMQTPYITNSGGILDPANLRTIP